MKTVERFSNRCFIYKDSDVERFNPDKNLRKLESLLDSALNLKEDIWRLLSFVYFDDSASEKVTTIRTANNRREKEIPANLIQKEKFDDIRIGNRSSVLSIPDVRVVEILLNSLSESDKGDEGLEMTDDIDSSIDIDDGNNEYQVKLKSHVQVSFSDCVARYTKNLQAIIINALRTYTQRPGNMAMTYSNLLSCLRQGKLRLSTFLMS